MGWPPRSRKFATPSTGMNGGEGRAEETTAVIFSVVILEEY